MNNRISARQLCTAGFTGLLSLSAAAAGMGWRGALLAVPVVLLAVWAAASAARRTGGLLAGVPGWLGKLLATLYIMWGVFAAGTVLALCGKRLEAAVGREDPFWLTALAVLPVLYLAVSKPEAFARAAEIFYLVMLAAVAAVLLLGMDQVEWRYLLAPGEGLGQSFFTAAGLGCLWVYAVLLWNGKGAGERTRWLGWSAAGAAALAALGAFTVGTLSPALAGREDGAFFLAAVGLGRTARTEALIAMVWLTADVTLVGLLLHACRGLWSDVLGFRGRRSVGAALTAAVFAVALLEGFFARPAELLRTALPAGSLLLGGVVPLLLRMAGKRENVEK